MLTIFIMCRIVTCSQDNDFEAFCVKIKQIHKNQTQNLKANTCKMDQNKLKKNKPKNMPKTP